MKLFPARRRCVPSATVLRWRGCKHVERIFDGPDETAKAALRRAGTRFELAQVSHAEAMAQLLADRCGEGGCGRG